MPHHEPPPPLKHLFSAPPLTPLRAIPYTLPPSPPLATGSTSRILLAHTITTASPIALKLPLPSTPASTATHEARILTHLTHHSTSTHFPRFHGLDPQNHALLLELLPRGTLRTHSLTLRRNNPGFLREPVGGARAWLLLARELCTAFLELKALGVVHGDVSWSNILLRNDDGEGAAQICVVDFSQASMRGAEARQGVVSAGFCAPEVLEGLVKGWEGGWGCEQDGYSVCMVLLASALGEEVYGGGRYESVWARQGRPLEWVAGGDGGAVVRGVVGRVLRGCFGVRVGERVGLEEVGVRVEQELAKLDETRG